MERLDFQNNIDEIFYVLFRMKNVDIFFKKKSFFFENCNFEICLIKLHNSSQVNNSVSVTGGENSEIKFSTSEEKLFVKPRLLDQ